MSKKPRPIHPNAPRSAPQIAGSNGGPGEAVGQFRLFIEQGPLAVAMFDCDMRYLALSQRWRTDYGLGDRDVVGVSHYDVFPEISEARRAEHRRALAGEILSSNEDRFRLPDGSRGWSRWTMRPWIDTSGRIGGIVIATENITGRKRVEAELRRSEALLRSATHTAGVGLMVFDREHRYVYANPLYTQILGLGSIDVIGKHPVDVLGTLFHDRIAPGIDRALAGERVSYDVARPKVDATVGYYTVVLEPLRTGHRVSHVVGVVYDITGPKQSERRIAEAEERLRLANEAAGIGTFDVDLLARTAHYSPELRAMLGVPDAVVVHLADAFARVHRDDVAAVRQRYDAALDPAGNGRLRMEFRFVRPGGDTRWMIWNGQVAFAEAPDGRVPVRFVGACVDITDRKRMEQDLLASEARYRGVVEGSLQGIVIQQDERIVYANPAMARIFGYGGPGEMLGMSTFDDFVAEAERPALRARTAAAYAGVKLDPHPGWRGYRRDGTEIWLSAMAHLVAWRGRPALVSFYLDITERKRADDRQQMMTRELDHRVKNTLARVLVILQRSAEGAASVGELATSLEGRVQALAEAHSQLSRRAWRGAELTRLVAAELEPFASAGNTDVDGPEIMLQPDAAQAMALVLHELATNAAKYGALSTATGRVRVRWRQDRSPAADPRLVVEWIETGGPKTRPPARKGYGSSVIAELIPYELGGTVAVEFRPGGLSFKATLPLAHVEASEA